MSPEVISPAQILLIVRTTTIRHSNFSFSSFYNSFYWNLEILYLFFPVFFSALFLSILLFFFYSSFCSLFCFPPSCLFTLSCDVSYCFLFKSVILSFLSSYNSILSASPLCSITIQSVLFLLEPSI